MQPGVPRYRSRIDSLEKHFFESPAHMMAPLTVCLNSGEYPHECIGALNPVDPSELRDALRQAVARAITDKQPAATLRKWRDVLMSTVVEFEAELSVFFSNNCYPRSPSIIVCQCKTS